MKETVNDKYVRNRNYRTIPMNQSNHEFSSHDWGRLINRVDARRNGLGYREHLILNYTRPEDFVQKHTRHGDSRREFDSKPLNTYCLFDTVFLAERLQKGQLINCTVEDWASRICQTFALEKDFKIPSTLYIIEPVAKTKEEVMETMGLDGLDVVVSRIKITRGKYAIEDIFKVAWNQEVSQDEIQKVCNNLRQGLSWKQLKVIHNTLILVDPLHHSEQEKFQRACCINTNAETNTYIFFVGSISHEIKLLLGGGLIALDPSFPKKGKEGGLLIITPGTGRSYAMKPYNRIDSMTATCQYQDVLLPLEPELPKAEYSEQTRELDVTVKDKIVAFQLSWKDFLPQGIVIADEEIDGLDWMHINVFAWSDYWGFMFVCAENSKNQFILHIFI